MTAGAYLCVLRHPRKPVEASTGLLCTHHALALNEALQDILELWALVPLYLLPGSGTDDGSRHTKTADPPAPGNLHVMSLRDSRMFAPRPPGDQLWFQETDDIPDAPGTLRERAELVADERRITNPDLGTISATVLFLRTHRDWIAARDWVADYDDELHILRRALSLGPGERTRPVGACPTLDGDGKPCGGPLWADRYGAMQVTCGRCERVFDEPMLRHLGGMMTA